MVDGTVAYRLRVVRTLAAGNYCNKLSTPEVGSGGPGSIPGCRLEQASGVLLQRARPHTGLAAERGTLLGGETLPLVRCLTVVEEHFVLQVTLRVRGAIDGPQLLQCAGV